MVQQQAPFQPPDVPGTLEDASAQYLTFILNGEEYGIEILGIQEIKGWEKGTAIPNTPDYLLGVINLRGSVVPVIDLRRRLGLEAREITKLTVVIVVLVEGKGGQMPVGLVVDAVSDVHAIEDAGIQAPPDLCLDVGIEFVRGLATVNDKMIVILDVNRIVRPESVTPREVVADGH